MTLKSGSSELVAFESLGATSYLPSVVTMAVSLTVYQILIQKTLEVLSLLRPIVHDTSKTAKITWFLLVLHWAVDVIEVIYYILGPVEY